MQHSNGRWTAALHHNSIVVKAEMQQEDGILIPMHHAGLHTQATQLVLSNTTA